MQEYQQISLALVNAISSQKNTREQSEQFLKNMHNSVHFFQKLIFIINSPQQQQVQEDFENQYSQEQKINLQNINLIAAIYLTNDIRLNYVSYPQDIKASLQEWILDAFLVNGNKKVKEQLMVAINRMVVTDFPDSMIFRLLLQNMQEENILKEQNIQNVKTLIQLVYQIFKALYKDMLGKGTMSIENVCQEAFKEKTGIIKSIIDQYMESLCKFNATYSFDICGKNKEVYWQRLQEGLQNFNTDVLKFSLKFLNLENYFSIRTNINVPDIVNHIQNLQVLVQDIMKLLDLENSEQQSPIFNALHEIRNVVYFYHKYLINCIREHRIAQQDSIIIMDYLKKFYFQNPNNLSLNNQSCISSEQLEQSKLLEKLQNSLILTQFFEDENSQIIQAIMTANVILSTLGKHALIDLQIDEGLYEGMTEQTMQQYNFIDTYFDENYYELVIKFLIENVLQLNWSQLYQIQFEPEKTFAEDILYSTNNISHSIRAASIQLIRVMHEYVNETKLEILLDQLLQQFSSSILTGGSGFKDILIRESFYFLIFGMYRILKNTLDFDVWFESVLSTELQQNHIKLLPLRIGILKLISAYIENSYMIPIPMCQTLSQNMILVINDKQNNLFLRLQALKNFVPLLLTAHSQEMLQALEAIMQQAIELSEDCVEFESKSIILEFIENLIHKLKNKISHYMQSIFNFIKKQWKFIQDSKNSNSNVLELMPLKSKVATILKKIIATQNELHFQEFEFYYNVIEDALNTNEGMESFLVEDCGLSLLHQFLMSYNAQIFKLSPEQKEQQKQSLQMFQQGFIQLLQKMIPIFEQQMDVFRMSVLIFMEFSHIQNPQIAQILSEVFVSGVKIYQEELKEDIFVSIYDAIEMLQIQYPVDQFETTFNMSNQICQEIINSAQKSEQNGENSQFQQLSLLRVLGRAYYQNFQSGQQIVYNINKDSELLFQILNSASLFLNKIKPDLCFYRYHCVLLLAYLQSLLLNNNEQSLIELFQNIEIQDSNNNNNNNQQQKLNIEEKVEICFQNLLSNYDIIHQYYNCSISLESHWITKNIDELISSSHYNNQYNKLRQDIIGFEEQNEEKQNQQQQYMDSEITPVYLNSALMCFLRQDQLKKYDFGKEGKNFFIRFQSAMRSQLQNKISEMFQQYNHLL